MESAQKAYSLAPLLGSALLLLFLPVLLWFAGRLSRPILQLVLSIRASANLILVAESIAMRAR